MLVSNLLKKFQQNSHAKNYEKNKLPNMSKSEKCVISVSLKVDGNEK